MKGPRLENSDFFLLVYCPNEKPHPWFDFAHHERWGFPINITTEGSFDQSHFSGLIELPRL
jgi:hypothetical protein